MKPLRLFFLLLFLLALCPFSASATDTPDYIRLHILADSNSLSDQSIKLGVRDAVREYASSLLSDCTNPDTAWELLKEHQEELLCTARTRAAAYGFKDAVSIELGVFPFPDRTYGGELVPAGDYRAVRIILGEGEGRNWWCVIYPSLCLPDEADVDRPIEFYSSILRWLMKIREAFQA